jgi:hypothetical protein
MTSLLAIIRPDEFNVPLLVHVAGAMVLVGGLLTASSAALMARSDSTASLARFSFRTLLLVALPGFIVMRAGAQWIYDKEGYGDGGEEPAWIGIGYATSDIGALLLLIALILGGVGLRRSRRGDGDGLLRASGWIALVLLAVYVVTVWAMGAKPS